MRGKTQINYGEKNKLLKYYQCGLRVRLERLAF